uniref:Uncharacterized protein n=1 Tax=Chromera velia CCMP2878 TaxID=1169474 RepID=A0A0G4FNE0_9ALVE|eukprot:Cvel_17930.t1-p1 / transcript=Cvel_17930.t1 / gene=Cvel_17930 / organism=Chromera_velia_CCMP2878 / gene_product=hypothetical protein / transcript_product=hypothetical protein / location=Cvel_scaffold1457:28729-34938(-) / protein_length=621 / sequence_SO=supercontig / SO=protein_coding / is_pseudo=false
MAHPSFSPELEQRLHRRHGPSSRWPHLCFKECYTFFETVGKKGTDDDVKKAAEGWGLLDAAQQGNSAYEAEDGRRVFFQLGQPQVWMYGALGLLRGLMEAGNVTEFERMLPLMKLNRFIDKMDLPTQDGTPLKQATNLLGWLLYQAGRQGDRRFIDALKAICESGEQGLSQTQFYRGPLYDGIIYGNHFGLLAIYKAPDYFNIKKTLLSYVRNPPSFSKGDSGREYIPSRSFQTAIQEKYPEGKRYPPEEHIERPFRVYAFGFHTALLGFSKDVQWTLKSFRTYLQVRPPDHPDDTNGLKRWELAKGLLAGAAFAGKVELLEWLGQPGEGMHVQERITLTSMGGLSCNFEHMQLQDVCLCIASRKGHLHLVEWLTDKGVRHEKAILESIRGTQPHVFFYLREKGKICTYEQALAAAREDGAWDMFHLLNAMGKPVFLFGSGPDMSQQALREREQEVQRGAREGREEEAIDGETKQSLAVSSAPTTASASRTPAQSDTLQFLKDRAGAWAWMPVQDPLPEDGDSDWSDSEPGHRPPKGSRSSSSLRGSDDEEEEELLSGAEDEREWGEAGRIRGRYSDRKPTQGDGMASGSLPGSTEAPPSPSSRPTKGSVQRRSGSDDDWT